MLMISYLTIRLLATNRNMNLYEGKFGEERMTLFEKYLDLQFHGSLAQCILY